MQARTQDTYPAQAEQANAHVQEELGALVAIESEAVDLQLPELAQAGVGQVVLQIGLTTGDLRAHNNEH